MVRIRPPPPEKDKENLSFFILYNTLYVERVKVFKLTIMYINDTIYKENLILVLIKRGGGKRAQ